MQAKKRLFITGVKRSGTTFCANFLNAQDHFTIYADFLRSLFDVGSQLKISDIHADLDMRSKNVLTSNLIAEGMMFNKTEFREIKSDSFNSWEDLFERSLTMVSPDSDKWLGIKKTDELHFIKELLDKGHKIIYLIRDPRDVLISSKNRFGTYNMYRIANIWKNSLQYISRFRGHKNLLLLKFEDLIHREESVIKEMQTFLGTELNFMLDRSKIRDDSQFIDNSSFGDIEKMFDENAIFRWKKEPESPEVRFASRYLKNQIDEWGYENREVSLSTYFPYFARNFKFVNKKRIANFLRKIFD